jgi:4-amino-4-deoxy-L-arabinose transferase-like glycosyltransferase
MTTGSGPLPSPHATAVLHRTAWIVVLAAAFGMLFPVVLLGGMSLDGITYATVARNLSIGQGDFWHPSYTATVYPAFHEQPPLALWLESLLFRAFGDVWWVERLYSVLTALPTGALVVLIWRRLLAPWPQWQTYGWLSIALWIVVPGWFWIYRHNFLENSMGVFTALAVYAALRSLDSRRLGVCWSALAGVAVAAAVGSKGPVGLFPLVTPTVAYLTLGGTSRRRSFGMQLALVFALATVIGLVMLEADARAFTQAYLNEQVFNSIRGARETVNSGWGRFELASGLVIDLLPSAAIVAGMVYVARRVAGCAVGWGPRGPLVFALVTAASASLPIMVSPKQSAYYAAPSWPFFAMALAIACLPAADALADRWVHSAHFARSAGRLRVAAACGVSALVLSSPLWCGMMFRDRALVDDVDRIAEIVGPRATLAAGSEVREEWSLQAYLYRRHFISVAVDDRPRRYRLELVEHPAAPSTGDTLQDAGLALFRLYRRAELAAGPDPAPIAR